MHTDWLVYRCDECYSTVYVNLVISDTYRPSCGHAARLVELVDEREFCQALRATI